MSLNVTFMSLNVRGLHKEGKRRSVFQFIRRKKVDVCFLQETYSTDSVQDKWKNEWGGEVIFAHGTNHSKGVMVLFRPGFDVVYKEKYIDKQGRYIIINATVQGTSVQLVNIYAPNMEAEQIIFYEDMSRLLSEYTMDKCYVITGGDMNVILDHTIDRKGGNVKGSKQYDKELKAVNNMLFEHELSDIWRVMNPNTKRYTWRRKDPQIHSRLDMWWISEALQDSCEKVDIIPSIRSDHSAIVLKLRTVEVKQGKGLWKLNNSFLDEENYVKGIKESLAEWENEAEGLDKRMVWEFIKYKIRDFSGCYGKEKAKKKYMKRG